MLRWLLSNDPEALKARRQCDWLLVPMLDPDMAARAVFTDANFFNNIPPVRTEAVAYATYLVNRIDAGLRLDIAINLHNVECMEGPNLFTPLVNRVREDAIKSLNEELWRTAQHAGFTTYQPDWSMVGLAHQRLSGWCFKVFRTFDLFYEVNGRSPDSRLSPVRLKLLGQLMAQYGANIACSDPMSKIHVEITQYLTERNAERAAWWQRQGRDANTRTTGDLLVLGY